MLDQAIRPSTVLAEQDRIVLDPNLLTELHELGHRHYGRLTTFILLYLASAWFVYRLAMELPHDGWRWLACAPLYLLAAASLHGISLFTHEGVHGTLSRNRHWNRLLSILCAAPVLQNYSAYKVLHLKHHSFLGKEGDPDHYANYTSWTWLEFLMHWGRLIIGYPAYITAIPVLGYRQGTSTDRRWIAFELLLLAALVALVLVSPLPWMLLLHGWLIPMVVINTLVNIRGMSQHTFLEHHTDPILGTRSILTNPVTAYFMCNENYHLEHHLYPGVPWFNLKRLHRALRSELIVRGAPFVPSYFAFVREFVISSLRLSPLGHRSSLVASRQLYRYEWLLPGLGTATVMALLVQSAPLPMVAEVGGATLIYALLALALRRKVETVWQKLRLISAYAFVAWFYSAIYRITPALGTTLRDANLLALDETVLGTTPAVLCQRLVTPWLTDLLSACYLSYHIYLPMALIHALWQPLDFSRRWGNYIFSAFATGLAGYLLLPAIGPAIVFPELFTTPLAGGFLTQLNAAIVAWGSSVYDAFPSLHVLITCVLLNHDWRHVRKRFWIMFLPALGMLLATIYLRYHYAADLAAGLALFVLVRGWSGGINACPTSSNP